MHAYVYVHVLSWYLSVCVCLFNTISQMSRHHTFVTHVSLLLETFEIRTSQPRFVTHTHQSHQAKIFNHGPFSAQRHCFHDSIQLTWNIPWPTCFKPLFAVMERKENPTHTHTQTMDSGRSYVIASVPWWTFKYQIMDYCCSSGFYQLWHFPTRFQPIHWDTPGRGGHHHEVHWDLVRLRGHDWLQCIFEMPRARIERILLYKSLQVFWKSDLTHTLVQLITTVFGNRILLILYCIFSFSGLTNYECTASATVGSLYPNIAP